MPNGIILKNEPPPPDSDNPAAPSDKDSGTESPFGRAGHLSLISGASWCSFGANTMETMDIIDSMDVFSQFSEPMWTQQTLSHAMDTLTLKRQVGGSSPGGVIQSRRDAGLLVNSENEGYSIRKNQIIFLFDLPIAF